MARQKYRTSSIEISQANELSLTTVTSGLI
jgi:hypothetical protein